MERPDSEKRRGVLADDVDDVVGIAAKLQEQADADEQATAEEVAAVARELDVDPKYIAPATEQLAADRAAAVEAAKHAAETQAKTLRWAAYAAAALLAVCVALGGLTLLTASVGAGPVNAASHEADEAADHLAIALDRQASVVPLLLGVTGGDVASVDAARTALLDAKTTDEKLRASLELDAAMGGALAALPATTEATSQERRSSVEYEVVGARNRIDTEQRRWRDAVRAWEAAADSTTGGLAIAVGFAEAPPE